MTEFMGTGVALVTPFNTDMSIDFAALDKVVDHVIEGGVEFLVALGTTGGDLGRILVVPVGEGLRGRVGMRRSRPGRDEGLDVRLGPALLRGSGQGKTRPQKPESA